MPYTDPSGVSRIAYCVRRTAPPAIARLTRLIVRAATADRRNSQPKRVAGASRRLMPPARSGARRALCVAATADGRMGGAIGDERLFETKAIIHREGARHSTR